MIEFKSISLIIVVYSILVVDWFFLIYPLAITKTDLLGALTHSSFLVAGNSDLG